MGEFEEDIRKISYIQGFVLATIIGLAIFIVYINFISPNESGKYIEKKIMETDPDITSCLILKQNKYYNAYCRFFKNETSFEQMVKLECVQDNDEVWCKPDGILMKAQN